jgi:hypothetical protein
VGLDFFAGSRGRGSAPTAADERLDRGSTSVVAGVFALRSPCSDIPIVRLNAARLLPTARGFHRERLDQRASSRRAAAARRWSRVGGHRSRPCARSPYRW